METGPVHFGRNRMLVVTDLMMSESSLLDPWKSEAGIRNFNRQMDLLKKEHSELANLDSLRIINLLLDRTAERIAQEVLSFPNRGPLFLTGPWANYWLPRLRIFNLNLELDPDSNWVHVRANLNGAKSSVRVSKDGIH